MLCCTEEPHLFQDEAFATDLRRRLGYVFFLRAIFLSLRILLPILRLPLGLPCLRARGLGMLLYRSWVCHMLYL